MFADQFGLVCLNVVGLHCCPDGNFNNGVHVDSYLLDDSPASIAGCNPSYGDHQKVKDGKVLLKMKSCNGHRVINAN